MDQLFNRPTSREEANVQYWATQISRQLHNRVTPGELVSICWRRTGWVATNRAIIAEMYRYVFGRLDKYVTSKRMPPFIPHIEDTKELKFYVESLHSETTIDKVDYTDEVLHMKKLVLKVLSRLSRTSRDVVRLALEGKRNAEIASELGIGNHLIGCRKMAGVESIKRLLYREIEKLNEQAA